MVIVIFIFMKEYDYMEIYKGYNIFYYFYYWELINVKILIDDSFFLCAVLLFEIVLVIRI